MKKEKWKSLLLVTLFVVSIFLTQQLWIILPIGQVVTTNNTDIKNMNINVSDILSPQSFVVSFGGGNHTVFFAEPYEIWNITNPNNKEKIWIWKASKSILKDYLSQDYKIEEINKEDWTTINNFKSIRLDFACEIPSGSLIGALTNNENSLHKTPSPINSILIPAIESEKNNIYIANTNMDKYIRIKGDVRDNKVNQLIESIELIGEQKGYISYYPLKDYVPVSNQLLTPIFDEISIPRIKVTNEIDVDKAQVRTLANTFFGHNFDFVKEITETDGTIIYMYGYGEKALKINKSGLLEHIEKVNKERQDYDLNFIDSLKIGAQFVKDHVGWPINSQNAYLAKYELVEKDKKKGYRFYFNYRLNGLPVYIANMGAEHSLEVEVIGNQVTYYKRLVKRFSERQEINKRVPFIIEILDKNLETIKDSYIKNNAQEEKVDYLKILEEIKELKVVYYYTEDVLVPAWKLVIDNTVYYFDLYEGDILNSYQD